MIRNSFIVITIIIIIAALVHHFRAGRTLPSIQRIVATQPATQPTTRRAPKPVYPSYMEIIRSQNQAVASTQPLDAPLDLADAAHLICHDPVYLDSIGNLWITRTDGQPTKSALADATNTIEHLIPDKPVFVHWAQDESGNWSADIIVHSKNGYDLVTQKGQKYFAPDRAFDWKSAYSFANQIVVRTNMGVSVFDVAPTVQEHYRELPGCSSKTHPPVTLLDTRGLLAWSPWENGQQGSAGVSRFIEGRWMEMPADTWPAKPIQLVMLLDGSVLCMAADQADQVSISIAQLELPQFDEKHVNELIAQLSDPDSEQRQAAFDELSRYGPAIGPVLEKAEDDQLPEAKMRIHHLLGNKIAPALGGITPVNKRLQVIHRYPEGTVLFYAAEGVQVQTGREDPDVITPAWLSLKPDGHMSRPLPAAMVGDQKPDACTLFAYHDEWLMFDESGMKRWVGSAFMPLLATSEQQFTDLVGIGAGYRWVFKDHTGKADTLILDPRIADPTPKLPVWTIAAPNCTVGWSAENYPALSRADDGTALALGADSWKPLIAPDKLHSKIEPTPRPTTNPLSLPILIAPDGTRYFDGKSSLVQINPNGAKISWALPATAVGSTDPILMQTSEGLLFLFNEPGRLLRIRLTPKSTEPFKLEAVFTTGIPSSQHPIRIWLDPAGRIDFVTDDNVLSVTFPSGNIPKEISHMMLDDKQ